MEVWETTSEDLIDKETFDRSFDHALFLAKLEMNSRLTVDLNSNKVKINNSDGESSRDSVNDGDSGFQQLDHTDFNDNKDINPKCDRSDQVAPYIPYDYDPLTEESEFHVDSKPGRGASQKLNGVKERLFSCRHCKFEGRSKGAFEKHVSKEHKSYQKCKWCDYTCFGREKLRVHRAGHRTFVCDGCTFKAATQKAMNTHRKNMHEFFECTECEFKAHGFVLLKPHLETVHGKQANLIELKVSNKVQNEKAGKKI